MKQIRITLLSDLCAGNGASLGNRIDTDIVTDEWGLPYIPGRRLRGCLRQSAMLLSDSGYILPVSKAPFDRDMVDRLFGTPERAGALTVGNAYLPAYKEMVHTVRRVREDRTLPEGIASPAAVTALFTRVRGQTKLENGVAADNTLRYTRVLNAADLLHPEKPNEFLAEVRIENTDPAAEEALEACCKAFRHMGTHRNRGMGQVKCRVTDGPAEETARFPGSAAGKNGTVTLEYHVSLDAPVVLQGQDARRPEIPARAVIGCMASAWVARGGDPAGRLFDSLFQNGDVVWSALTPVIRGRASVPAPYALVRLKDSGEMRNTCFLTDEERAGKKAPLSGGYASGQADTVWVAVPETVSEYHHRHQSKNAEAILYRQDALKAGMLYGGRVTCPAALEAELRGLLSAASFRIGHSRGAQYAAVTVREIRDITAELPDTVSAAAGETVAVIPEADMILVKNGMYTTRHADIREAIAGRLGLSAEQPEEDDLCEDFETGGFQAMWGLRKPAIPTVGAGSVFFFRAVGGPLPAAVQIGEYPQEGMGRCRVMTKASMKKRIMKTEPDSCGSDTDKESAGMLSLLLTGAAAEAMRLTAAETVRRHPEWLAAADSGFLSRLRLMLRESKTPENLRISIGQVADEHRRKLGTEFFGALYGSGEENDVIRTMLKSVPAVAEAVLSDQAAGSAVLAAWKKPAAYVLHDLYYASRTAAADRGGDIG